MSSTMKLYKKLISTLIIIAFISGCAGTRHTLISPDINLKEYKKAFIIANEHSKFQTANIILFPGGATAVPGKIKEVNTKGNIPSAIQRELAKYEIISIIGKTSDNIPDDIDIIVKYEDLWDWDFKYYISTLTLKLIDKKTGKEMAQGNFKSAIAHNFPDVDEEIAVMIKDIFKIDK